MDRAAGVFACHEGVHLLIPPPDLLGEKVLELTRFLSLDDQEARCLLEARLTALPPH